MIHVKQRMLLLIAEKEQMIHGLSTVIPKMETKSEMAKKDYHQGFKNIKFQNDKGILLSKPISESDRSTVKNFETEIMGENGLFEIFQKSETELEAFREKCTEFKGLPSNIKLAQIKVAQAHEELIQKQEKLNRILES
mmetsp:Transcript_6632/g.5736  ORF Transcript_6632/g.5736 Transcript_6632/m.5736 type:complete len:138 (+) Transcript_6632:416-829(+)